MPFTWFKRLLFIIVPIAFYVLGLYGVDILVSNHILKPEEFGGGLKFFVESNFFVIFVYWVLLVVVLNKNTKSKDDISIPFWTSVALFIIPSMDFLPDWVSECYILVFPASAIYMSYLTFKYDRIEFVDIIWQLENQKCVWIFNKDHSLILNSADNSTTFFTWKYNHVTSTITIFNDKEKRCYSIHTVSPYRLTLMRIPSLETLTFLPRESGSPVIITQPSNQVAK